MPRASRTPALARKIAPAVEAVIGNSSEADLLLSATDENALASP
jgi:hypothetical protein